MTKVRLLHRAEADLIVIAGYTTAQFGTQQAHVYRDGLLATLDALAEQPLMGSARVPYEVYERMRAALAG